MSEFYKNAAMLHGDTVREMLASRPDANSFQYRSGISPHIHGVAGEEQFEVAEFLLDAAADPNARNDEGDYAASLGCLSRDGESSCLSRRGHQCAFQ